MVGLIIKLVVGAALFVGALVGGLAATGRLNHEGTANIPLLSSFFPAPPPPAEGEGAHADGAHGTGAQDAAGHTADGSAPAPAMHDGEASMADATHANDGDPQDPQKPRRSKVGRSLVEPEKPAGDGHGGGDEHGGVDEHGGGSEHGGGDAHGAKDPAAGHEPKKATPPAAPAGEHAPAHGPEGDFAGVERALQSQGKTGYAPGALFRFDGMPAGLTPQQLNEAWQRVQGVMQELDRKKQALDLREQELRELADDISRRWKELGDERLQVEQMQRQLDTKIQQFQQTVKLVRNDEAALLKRNADTLASFERGKAAELITQQWQTEKGQDEVLKMLEFMDKDAVNEILAELPGPMVQDLLKKRLRVSKESTPPGGRK